MAPKRKASNESGAQAPKRRENGIKGITVAEKSNDPLRDEILDTLRNSGISHSVESRIVFAHTGIYVGNVLFGWVGPGGFALRCGNAAQKKACEDTGCPPMEDGHKNYFNVPESVRKSKAKLRSLAEAFVANPPPVKSRTTKKK